jgi:hypothetical protein
VLSKEAEQEGLVSRGHVFKRSHCGSLFSQQGVLG